MKGEVVYISYAQAVEFLLPRHYSGRIPSVSYSFGWKIDGELKAVCTFGKPASRNLCDGICGIEYSQRVYELNRLCRTDDLKEQLSCFVSACLRRLKIHNIIIVSYSDTGMHHNGYIYQACNFIYTGVTKKRTDKYTEGNKHSRHYSKHDKSGLRKVRTAKHRYVFFCADRREASKMRMSLRYRIEPFPKGENKNYVLGEYQKTEVIKEARTP